MGDIMRSGNMTEKLTIGALLTAVFAVTALAFKGFVIIPGITEIRPVNAFPICFGLLFGSVGALACGLGNFIGDLIGGTLTPGSIGGFIGNYAMAYVPFKVWQGMKGKDEKAFLLNSWRQYMLFSFLCLLSSTTAAGIIPLFTDIIQMAPYTILFGIILVNDLVAELLLGTIIYKFLASIVIYGVLRPTWQRICDETVVSLRQSRLLTAITLLCLIAGVVFFFTTPKGYGNTVVLYTMGSISVLMVVGMKA
jgi:energy-coupling factor transport system substrate-specific component